MLRSLFLLALFSCFFSHAAPVWNNKIVGGDDYLVGTIHLGDERFAKLSDKIKSAVDAVDVVVLEIDIATFDQDSQQQMAMKYGLLPQGKTLRTELSKEVYQQVKDYLAEFGYNIEVFAQLKPWMLGLTMVQLHYMREGLEVDKGVDQQIYTYAKQQGKKVIGLETTEQQMQFFEQVMASSAEITNDDLILDTLYELKSHPEMPQQMATAWLKGDMAVFKQIYNKTVGKTKFDVIAEKIMLTDRNKNWQRQLAPILKQQKALVAVGTLHFVGPYSLLKLLDDTYTQL